MICDKKNLKCFLVKLASKNFEMMINKYCANEITKTCLRCGQNEIKATIIGKNNNRLTMKMMKRSTKRQNV